MKNTGNESKKEAHTRGITPSQLMIPATLEAIEYREWLRTEAEIYLFRSAMFAAQTTLCGIWNGTESDIP